MKIVGANSIRDKKVLLRLDIDVPIASGQILDDYRLKRGLETVQLCLDQAKRTTIIGHIGRPASTADESLSTKVIANWMGEHLLGSWREDSLQVAENLRFDPREDSCDEGFAQELKADNDLYVNEAFAAHHQAASTTVVPKLLPSFAGLNFFKEVTQLKRIRTHPKRPLVAIIGGAKIEDKYSAVLALSKFCDAVLVGGLLAKLIKDQKKDINRNVLLGRLQEDGLDLADETIAAFAKIIKEAKEIIWAGPVGKYEIPEDNLGDQALVKAVIESGAESIIGGGDTEDALKRYLDKLTFVSTGGGAMLELLATGTLPTIEALKG